MSQIQGPSIIDILVVIDGETIFNTLGQGGATVDQAVTLSSDLAKDVYMVCQRKYLAPDIMPNSEATNFLAIKANRLDVIRWRGCSISNNDWCKISMAKLLFYSGTNVLDGIHTVNFGDWDQVLEADVVHRGTETYDLVFEVFGSDGTSKGFYSWDPYIEVVY